LSHGWNAWHELRSRTRALLERLEAGEAITITLEGRPVAVVGPSGRRPRWLRRNEFARRMMHHQADPDLARAIRHLAPDMTDELPLS
jgi:antitoxin (DNA-binding transcriptional repressor) of toxin-antitoxin stability system